MSIRSRRGAASPEGCAGCAAALQRLVEIAGPIPGLIQELDRTSSGADDESVELTTDHAVRALEMFKSGALTKEDLRSWAEALECREDLAYDGDVLGQLLFEIATPEINRPITRGLADEWLAQLSRPR